MWDDKFSHTSEILLRILFLVLRFENMAFFPDFNNE